MPLKTKFSTPSIRVLATQNIRLTSILSIFVMFFALFWRGCFWKCLAPEAVKAFPTFFIWFVAPQHVLYVGWDEVRIPAFRTETRVTVGWANGSIVNPTLMSSSRVGWVEARAETHHKHPMWLICFVISSS